jgi:predicted lipid-binding transport protein (Tim44 family)
VSNQQRKLQISVMPRGGKTTVRLDDQLGNVAGGVFGGMMGGIGGGLGGAVMGSIAGGAHRPLLGLVAWLSVVTSAFAGARFTLRRIFNSRREKLHDVATLIANQIAESTAAPPAPNDPPRRIG